MLAQPRINPVFKYRRCIARAVALAMNDAHRADLLLAADVDKYEQGRTRCRCCHTVQVQLGTRGQLAALETLQHAFLDAGPCVRQGFTAGDFAKVARIGKAVSGDGIHHILVLAWPWGGSVFDGTGLVMMGFLDWPDTAPEQVDFFGRGFFWTGHGAGGQVCAQNGHRTRTPPGLQYACAPWSGIIHRL